MVSALFSARHAERQQLLGDVRKTLEATTLEEAEQDERINARLDTYLHNKADADVLKKGDKLLQCAFDAFTPVQRARFNAALLPAVQRRRPLFGNAIALSQALATESLAAQNTASRLLQRLTLSAEKTAALRSEVATLMHEQALNERMAFTLGETLSDADLAAALAYYASVDGKSFNDKLPTLIAMEEKADIGPMGLLDSVLSSELRPEAAAVDPKLLKIQRFLALCRQTSGQSALSHKLFAEEAVDLFTDKELDVALTYWESPAAQHIAQAYEAFDASLSPQLTAKFVAALQEITERLSKV